MRILGIVVILIQGLMLLLPGLCFFAFGVFFATGLPASALGVLVWFGIGALLTWGAIAIFRQIGK